MSREFYFLKSLLTSRAEARKQATDERALFKKGSVFRPQQASQPERRASRQNMALGELPASVWLWFAGVVHSLNLKRLDSKYKLELIYLTFGV